MKHFINGVLYLLACVLLVGMVYAPQITTYVEGLLDA